MIKIICVGKIKKAYITEFINDYKKRISKFDNIKIFEVKDDSIKEEAKRIIKYIDDKDFIITTQIEGKNLISKQLAYLIDNTRTNGYSTITFIIGGSNGLDTKIKMLSNYSLSFSSLTFPHGLFRGILLEQIYRAFKIINNEPYNK
ncbi:MAG: 23S rRNA (pseudouridine(1915)-N(3))-methyltransferase RlmH [Bacilli bacterium]